MIFQEGIVMAERVKAKATVDKNDDGSYKVHVWGIEPHEFDRWYDIDGVKSDKDAAFKGIEMFVEEMEARDAASGNP